MKLKLFYSAIVVFNIAFCFSQEAKFKISPFVNGITSVENGQIELGTELYWEKLNKDRGFIIKPMFRAPLTSNLGNTIQIDRFSSKWKGILAFQFKLNNVKATNKIKSSDLSFQLEYGTSDFKYCPTGNSDDEIKVNKESYSFEIKYIAFSTKGESEAKQFSPQFRLRYSYDWKSSKEVGVVNPINENGVITTSSMIIDSPNSQSTFSPAFSLQIYPGKGNFSYSPSIYYDFIGKMNDKNPFNNLNRIRFENWLFFYPMISNNPNVKIGITPFLSIRTKGLDDFNKIEYGGMITIKFGTSFLHFL